MPRGVRLNPQHDERTRAKIQASQIINRLTDHLNGKCELSATQVRAGEILLRKVMPDLSTTHIEGRIDHGPVVILSDDTFAQWVSARLTEAAPIASRSNPPALIDGSVRTDLVGPGEARH